MSLALRAGSMGALSLMRRFNFARMKQRTTGSPSRFYSTMYPIARRYAAPIIQRAYRKYRGRRARKQPARTRVGMPVGTATARVQQVQQTLPIANQTSRTQYVREITDIAQGTAPNERNRDIVNFRGVKICCNFINESLGVNLFVNYAIISPKSGIDVDEQDFFRSHVANRGVDFNSPNLTSMDYKCRNINTDRYNIITHKRLTLASQNAALQNGSLRYSYQVMRYVKIQRQLRYNNLSDELGEKCTTPIFFIWWYDAEGLGTEAETVEVLNTDLRLMAYFRNPPN